MTARATNAVANWLNCCRVMANDFSGAYLSVASEETNFGHCGGNLSAELMPGKIGSAYGLWLANRLSRS